MFSQKLCWILWRVIEKWVSLQDSSMNEGGCILDKLMKGIGVSTEDHSRGWRGKWSAFQGASSWPKPEPKELLVLEKVGPLSESKALEMVNLINKLATQFGPSLYTNQCGRVPTLQSPCWCFGVTHDAFLSFLYLFSFFLFQIMLCCFFLGFSKSDYFYMQYLNLYVLFFKSWIFSKNGNIV
jgi:hypothetical protein